MENSKKELREGEPEGKNIFNKTLKEVLIILWHYAVFVRTGFVKSA